MPLCYRKDCLIGCITEYAKERAIAAKERSALLIPQRQCFALLACLFRLSVAVCVCVCVCCSLGSWAWACESERAGNTTHVQSEWTTATRLMQVGAAEGARVLVFVYVCVCASVHQWPLRESPMYIAAARVCVCAFFGSLSLLASAKQQR